MAGEEGLAMWGSALDLRCWEVEQGVADQERTGGGRVCMSMRFTVSKPKGAPPSLHHQTPTAVRTAALNMRLQALQHADNFCA